MSTYTKIGVIPVDITGNDIASLAFPGNIDEFGRIEVAAPQSLFSGQFTYDLHPLLYGQIADNATISHNSTNRCADMVFSSASDGDYCLMQSWQSLNYQPGKAQKIDITFNFKDDESNVKKFARYGRYDGVYIGCEKEAGIWKFVINSQTQMGKKTIPQSLWNKDKLDGSGDSETNPSGINLNDSKVEIFFIGFQALYVGMVAMGFNINGKSIIAHEFYHSNIEEVSYIQDANLPICVGMEATGEVASASMSFYCAAVISSGGQENEEDYTFSAEASLTAGNETTTHALSIEPRTTFNSIRNNVRIRLKSLEISVQGSNSIRWQLCFGQALTGTATTNVNATYSAVNTITGTLSGNPVLIPLRGVASSSVQAKSSGAKDLKIRYPITLDLDGAVRNLGRVTILVSGIGGTSACTAVLTWVEVR